MAINQSSIKNAISLYCKFDSFRREKPWHGTELCNVMDTLTFGSEFYIVSASKQYKWFRFAINNCLLILWHAVANYSRTSVSTAVGRRQRWGSKCHNWFDWKATVMQKCRAALFSSNGQPSCGLNAAILNTRGGGPWGSTCSWNGRPQRSPLLPSLQET